MVIQTQITYAHCGNYRKQKSSKLEKNDKPHTPQRKLLWTIWGLFFRTGFYCGYSFVYYLLR